MVYNVVFWLNNFTHRDGVHTTKMLELLEKQSKECCRPLLRWDNLFKRFSQLGDHRISLDN